LDFALGDEPSLLPASTLAVDLLLPKPNNFLTDLLDSDGSSLLLSPEGLLGDLPLRSDACLPDDLLLFFVASLDALEGVLMTSPCKGSCGPLSSTSCSVLAGVSPSDVALLFFFLVMTANQGYDGWRSPPNETNEGKKKSTTVESTTNRTRESWLL
jgi:hypothetical protein